jgi:hypothetical protein
VFDPKDRGHGSSPPSSDTARTFDHPGSDIWYTRLEGQRALLRVAVPADSLRPGLSMRTAADIVFTIGSPETYRSLVVERGWSSGRFEEWYADTLTRLLLPDPSG